MSRGPRPSAAAATDAASSDGPSELRPRTTTFSAKKILGKVVGALSPRRSSAGAEDEVPDFTRRTPHHFPPDV